MCVQLAKRSIVWVKEDGRGAEFAEVLIGHGRLTAVGTAFGLTPYPYRLDYKLETMNGFVTSGLLIEAVGQGWSRKLDLRRLRSGKWTARPGGALSGLGESVDCDLAWSPLTNSMPVLRHGLLTGGGPIEFVMAWVSVPDLTVHASAQRYTFVRRDGDHSIVRYESASRDFVADLVFDSDGLVISYPGIGQTPPPPG